MHQPYSAARHTFFYLIVLLTLSFTTVGLGQILFQVINSLFPETTYAYDSAYSIYTLRFGISSVIVAAPIFWFMSYTINKELAKKELDFHSGIRKWLTYLILLISSATIIGFLIGLLNNFLSGELTVKFTLKMLSALVIAAITFGYYFYDLKRTDFEPNKVIYIFRAVFFIVVVGSLVWGFWVHESPMKARYLREDETRVNQLGQISFQVENYYREQGALPSDLSLVEDRLYEDSLLDPVTDVPFQYRVLSETSYELCAVFHFSNREGLGGKGQLFIHGPYSPDWLHDEGRYCFVKYIEPSLVPEPREIPLLPKR